MTRKAFSGAFVGNFNALSKPDSKLQIYSQPASQDKFISSFGLHFSGQSVLKPLGVVILQINTSIQNIYTDSMYVYLNDDVGTTGEIQLINNG